MRVYLASTSTRRHMKDDLTQGKYYLESFFYFQPWQEILINDKFMLDSGAYTFIASNKHNEKIDWDKYVTAYGKFINKHDIKLFFELDIDPIVGIHEVERLRNKLENITGKKCIPVWHKSRGQQYYIDLVKSYGYVALGGIVTGEIKRKEHSFFNWFINKAHENNCQIHGLGYTSTGNLSKYKFDSVDSSSWVGAGRFGSLYQFNGHRIISHKRQGVRLKDRNVADLYNLGQWLKFQRYAEKHL